MEITPILCPTRGFSGVPATTLMTVVNTILQLGRKPMYVQTGAIGYATSRNKIVTALKERFPEQKVIRGFWIDDDILLLNSTEDLIPIIRRADSELWNIVGAYHTVAGTYTLAGKDRKLFTEEDYQELSPYDEVDLAGLGFYYGDIPLDYRFHENPLTPPGEDFHFFEDNRIKPRVAPLWIQHIKTLPI